MGRSWPIISKKPSFFALLFMDMRFRLLCFAHEQNIAFFSRVISRNIEVDSPGRFTDSECMHNFCLLH